MAARDLLDRFRETTRIRKPDLLGSWIAAAHESGLASFASGIARRPPSRSQTDRSSGQIAKLKLVNRQMYGCAKLDSLGARRVDAARPSAREICARPSFQSENAPQGGTAFRAISQPTTFSCRIARRAESPAFVGTAWNCGNSVATARNNKEAALLEQPSCISH